MAGGIDMGVLWQFVALWLVVVPTPGANSLFVTHVALTQGMRAALLAIAGNMVGILMLGSAALLGWAVALEAFPWLRRLVHVAGGLYLAYYGLQLWRAGGAVARAAAAGGEVAAPGAPAATLRLVAMGLATALSNAQAIVFISSILAVAGVLRASAATGAACVTAMIIANASYLAGLAALFQVESARRFYERRRAALLRLFAAVFGGLGGRLLWRELAMS